MADIEDRKPDDDADIVRVLRATGGREQPSAELEREIRAAAHAEWRAAVSQRARTRQRIWLAAAASVAIAAFGLWVLRVRTDAPRIVVASVSVVEGTVNAQTPSFPAGSWQRVAVQRSLRAGDTLATGPNGRAALTLANGISLRLDHHTRILLADAERVSMLSGAVYVDAGLEPTASRPLQIDTPAGSVRHLGTQYEIRLLQPGTVIRVREGRVELSGPSGPMEQLRAGEQLIVSANGQHERAAIDPGDVQWGWAGEIAPPFDIEGRSLDEFLTWVGRETGLEITFADVASEAEAAGVVLHGSTVGLRPSEALDAVLPTTRLRGEVRDGRVLLDLQ